jgi:P27 family predicted phage terminase small subunit
MGLRGPAPTPTKILEVRGSWRAKEREGEPRFPEARLSAPSWLGKEAKAEWKRVVNACAPLGILADVDRATLVAYCETWDEYCRLTRAIARRDRLARDVGQEEAPAESLELTLSQRHRAATQLVRLAGQFGFSPAARARVKAPGAAEEGEGGAKSRYFA